MNTLNSACMGILKCSDVKWTAAENIFVNIASKKI